nr:hypothetical protein CFP56_52310 [Quercus suber]
MRFLQNPQSPLKKKFSTQENLGSNQNTASPRQRKVLRYSGTHKEFGEQLYQVHDQSQANFIQVSLNQRANRSDEAEDRRKRSPTREGTDVLPGELLMNRGSSDRDRRANPSPSKDNSFYTWSVSDALPTTALPRNDFHLPRAKLDGDKFHDGQSLHTRNEVNAAPSRPRKSLLPEAGSRSRVCCARQSLPLTSSRGPLDRPQTQQLSLVTGGDTSNKQDSSVTKGVQLSARKLSSRARRSITPFEVVEDDRLRPDYRSSDILRIHRDFPRFATRKLTSTLRSPEVREAMAIHTSTPTARLLRQVQMATTAHSSPDGHDVVEEGPVRSGAALDQPLLPQLLLHRGLGTGSEQSPHRDRPDGAMFAHSRVDTANMVGTDRWQESSQTSMTSGYANRVPTGDLLERAGSRHDTLNLATTTSSPTRSAYSAHVNEHRWRQANFDDARPLAPDLDRRAKYIFEPSYTSDVQSSHRFRSRDSATCTAHEQSLRVPTSGGFGHRESIAYTNNALFGKIQSPKDWSQLGSDRIHTSARHTMPGNSLADFWRPQRL